MVGMVDEQRVRAVEHVREFNGGVRGPEGHGGGSCEDEEGSGC